MRLFSSWTRGLSCLALSLGFSCAIARADEAEKLRFLKEYAEAEKKLVDAYSHMVISATMTELRTQKEPANVFVVDYRSTGRRIKVDTYASGLNERGPFKRRFIKICNPDKGSFILDWNELLERFVVSATKADHKAFAESIHRDCPFAQAAHGFFELTVRETLDLEGLEVERLERIEVNGKSLAKLTTSQKTADGRVISAMRTFTFDPSRHWALVEYTFGLTKDRKAATTCQIEYAPSENTADVPLVKSMRRWHISPDGTRDQEMTVEVHSIGINDVPATEFTLAAFGISDKP